jgi:dihydroneopterin aldolase
VELARGGPYRLLERLAAVIADDLVARFGVTHARVRVAKPDVPISHQLDEVAVVAEASAGRNSGV